MTIQRLLFVGIGLLPSIMTNSASAQSVVNCHSYADQAVAYQRLNRQYRCGFRGTTWSSNRAGHYNWCIRVSPRARIAGHNVRVRMLNRCRGGVNRAAACRQYASLAVRQNLQNLRSRCGYRGARWTSNYRGHYGWCLRAAPHHSNNESRVRANMLRRCAGSGRFLTRWSKVGGGWTSGWQRSRRAVCGHSLPLCRRCPANSRCGLYAKGRRIRHAPYPSCRVYWILECQVRRR
jgi:hypothetical protein